MGTLILLVVLATSQATRPDLVTPETTAGDPAAGKRVRQFLKSYAGTGVYHLLYLSTN